MRALFGFESVRTSLRLMPQIHGFPRDCSTSRLSTLAALPINWASLAAHRYFGILVAQGVVLFVLAALALFAVKVIGTPVTEESIATIAAHAAVSLAVMAFYQLLAVIFRHWLDLMCLHGMR